MRRAMFSLRTLGVALPRQQSSARPWHALQCHTWRSFDSFNQSEANIRASFNVPSSVRSEQLNAANGSQRVDDSSMAWWPLGRPAKHVAAAGGISAASATASPSAATNFAALDPSFLSRLLQDPITSPSARTCTFHPDKHIKYGHAVEVTEAKRILHLAQLYSSYDKLTGINRDVMPHKELLDLSVDIGVASSRTDAIELVNRLEHANLILRLNDIVYLNPQKVVELINKIVPKPMSHDGKDHVLEEIKKLKEVEEDIDKLAKKYSHRVLWLGFGYLTLQMLLIFRLTFWELSWDVMEPIAYFVTNITLLVGYAFFMFTSKHPTYQNLVNIFSSAKKKKLMKSRNFDIAKLHELERRYGPCFTAKSIVS